MNKKEILIDFINEIAPDHCRTSCEDDSLSSGNHFFNSHGYPRCVRCALLYRVQHGEFPHGANAVVENIRLTYIK